MCALPFRPPPPGKVQSTIFAPPQEVNRGTTELHIRPKAYLTEAQQENPSDSGTGHIYPTGAGAKHVNYCVHTEPFSMFKLHFMLHSHIAPSTPTSIHYISRDHPNSHQLTNQIRHPSLEPGLRSPGALEKTLRRWYGIVSVSPTAIL